MLRLRLPRGECYAMSQPLSVPGRLCALGLQVLPFALFSALLVYVLEMLEDGDSAPSWLGQPFMHHYAYQERPTLTTDAVAY